MSQTTILADNGCPSEKYSITPYKSAKKMLKSHHRPQNNGVRVHRVPSL